MPSTALGALDSGSTSRTTINTNFTDLDAAVAAAGTVASVSVTTANGVSGSVATATTTPAITLTLGAITPSSAQISGLTASQILSTDASKNLTSLAVATYPSLTELSYVKGVTSALQTQITAKATNPMTTGGDVIYGGASGVPTRLANGSAGQVLHSNGTTLAPTWNTVSGLGDVVGPSSSVDNSIVRFDSTTGKLVQGYTSGSPTISDTGDVTLAATKTLSIGSQVMLRDVGTNASFLAGAGNSTSTATSNLAIGNSSNVASTSGGFNVFVGVFSGTATAAGAANTIVGYNALAENITGNNNTAIGVSAGRKATGTRGIYIGDSAGRYCVVNDEFYVNNRDRTDTATDKTASLLYGVMYTTAAVASQTLVTNAAFTATYGMNIPTGQTYKINGISMHPMTTGGDLIYGGASGVPTRLANGSAGQVLQSNGTTLAPSWTAAGSGDMNLASVQTITGAKTFGTIGGAVGKLILAGSTSGSSILNAAAVAGTTTFTLPSTSGTLVATGTELAMGANSVVFTQQTATGDSTTTIDWKLGNKFYFTFGNFNETFTFTAPSGVCSVTLVLKQYSTGGKTATWPASVKWPGGIAPTLSTGNDAVDIVSFYYDGTSYFGSASLNFS